MLKIDSLDQEGRGVARDGGKVVFVQGALPGELVEPRRLQRKPSFETAYALRVLQPSSLRVAPRCRHFDLCGGCSLQHLDARAQVAMKQRILEDNLLRIGKVTPEEMLPAIHGPSWGYRHRARLSVKFVPKKGGALVGFREKGSHFLVDMHACEVLPAKVSRLIDPLRALIGQLSVRQRLPQIEVAVADERTVLALRILAPLSERDEMLLREFSTLYAVEFYLQPGGADSMHPLDAQAGSPLSYDLPEFALRMEFAATDFTQVNHAINRVLVRRALALLGAQTGERVADMFCGLGNFSLAIARCGARVIGVEGSRELVGKARHNARLNGLEDLAKFEHGDLFLAPAELLARIGRVERMLIDPPRDGALELVRALAVPGPARIVYVSCSPATLARDAGILVHEKGYVLRTAGVINMFPHTSHVESIALFERDGRQAGA